MASRTQKPPIPLISLLLTLCGLLVVGPAFAQTPASAPSPAAEQAVSKRADALHVRGLKLMAQGQAEPARALLLEAYGLKQAYDIAGNLGAIELEMKKYRAAAEHLAQSLRNYPTTGNAGARTDTERRLEQARAEVATVRVTVNVKGATVTVDDAPIGEAPLPHELYVAPGRRLFKASHAGYAPVQVSRALAKGERTEVVLELTATAVSQPSRGQPPPVWPALLGGGVSVASLLVGIVFGAGLGPSQEDDADALRAELRATGGGCPGAPRCADVATAYADAQLSHNLSTGLVVGGAALGVATLVYAVVLAVSGSDPASTTSATLMAGPTPASIGLRIAF